jgi:protein-tyrosine phosphatase
MKKDPIRILFVCTGNICRSPTAHAILRKRILDRSLEAMVECDSAGTHAYHVGEGADPRSAKHGKRRGYDFSFHHARKVSRSDFHEFDWILAMDRGHLESLQEMSVPDQRAQIALFLSAIPGCKIEDTPDPYYGGDMGFEQVLDLCEQGCDAWLDKVLKGR